MSTISLAVYEVIIYKKNGSIKNTENISDFNNGSDLLNLFQKLPTFLNTSSSSITVLDLSQKRLKISSPEFKPFGRVISGVIETGEFGTENQIIDKSGNLVATKNKDHSAMSPFYFLCDLEKNSKRAILILQRFSQYGIYSIFSAVIKKEFEKQHHNYTIRISPLVSKKALDAVVKDGVIKKLTFKSIDPTKNSYNINSKNPSDYFNANEVYCEYNIVAKRNKSISLRNSISKILGVDAKVSDYITLREFDYNDIKVKFEINGKLQTISVNNWQNFSPDIDITSKVNINSAGFPIVGEIERATLDLLSDIKTELMR